MNLTFDVKVNNLPAITHVDGSARVQTVSKEENNHHKLIKRSGEISGVPILLNTSFNAMGQPMVCFKWML